MCPNVKAEVSRSLELDELKKMKESVPGAAKDIENTIQSGATDFEKSWSDATSMNSDSALGGDSPALESYPGISPPSKRWRVKQGAHAQLVTKGANRHPDQGIGPVRPGLPGSVHHKSRLTSALHPAPGVEYPAEFFGPSNKMTDSKPKEDELAGTEQPFVHT